MECLKNWLAAGAMLAVMAGGGIARGTGGTYLVVDMSGGPTAESWPVTEMDAMPEGGWPDEYRTQKMVLRRIEAGTFAMGSPESELGHEANEVLHLVTLSKPYYIGVFEVTQAQWTLAMGSNPSQFQAGNRPVDTVSYDMIRGTAAGARWPADHGVDEGCFVAVMRAKTGFAFDLPTEAQWEYACRAGTTNALNSGKDLTDLARCPNMDEVGRYYWNSSLSGNSDSRGGYGEHTVVGCYAPNAWGLYDMHGNVWEWCLDWAGDLTMDDVEDPVGPETGICRIPKGCCWHNEARYCRSGFRRVDIQPSFKNEAMGLRVVFPADDGGEDGPRTWYVSAETGNDGNDGRSERWPFVGIQKAIDVSGWGDRIVVGDGVYGPISVTNQLLTIESLNGAGATIIDGGGAACAASLGTYTPITGVWRDETNTYLKGFTLRNGFQADAAGGGVCFGTLESCIITGNTATNGGGSCGGMRIGCVISGNTAIGDGGGMYYGMAEGCELRDNSAGYAGGGAYYGTLERCVATGNSAYLGGGCANGTANDCLLAANTVTGGGGGAWYGRYTHCTFFGNSADAGGGQYAGTVLDSVFWGNTANYGADTCKANVSWCCAHGIVDQTGTGEGNLAADPLFADEAAWNFRLTAASPCVNAGEPGTEFAGTDLDGGARTKDGRTDMGAYEFDLPGVSGVWARPPVGGGLTPLGGRTLAEGESETWKAFGPRQFQGFYTNGAFATADATISLPGGGDDIVLEAVFVNDGPLFLYADALAGMDGDGATPETAVQTLQMAIDLAAEGDVVYAAPGVYGPISSGNKAIEIRASGEVAETVIDGGGSSRCATLGSGSGERATRLVGFTLRNGAVASEAGGGALGGTLDKCLLAGNVAYRGGGAADSLLEECTLEGNTATYAGGGACDVHATGCSFLNNKTSGYGGGAEKSTLVHCVVETNEAGRTGGGLVACTADRCVIRRNNAGWDGGGAGYSTLKNCLVAGNRASDNGGGVFGDYGSGEAVAVNCTVVENVAGGVGGGVAARIDTSGMVIGDGDDLHFAAVSLNNCIVWANALANGMDDNFGTVDANWAIVAESGSGILARYTCSAPSLSGSGNIESDPRFAGADDWHLAPESPCVDAGSGGWRSLWITYAGDSSSPVCLVFDEEIDASWLDLEGVERDLSAGIDMGAYERSRGESGDSSFEDIWGDWSSESATEPAIPASVSSWEELARAAWTARDVFVRRGTRTEIPPSDDPIILSLGAMAIPISMLPDGGNGLETETEQGVSVWRLHLRETESAGTRAFEATIGGMVVEIAVSPPSYPGESWVRAVYGEIPSWLDASERAGWLAARARTRIEWYVTLVPEGDWATYEANRQADVASALAGKNGAESLDFADLRIGVEGEVTSRLSLKSGTDGTAVRLLGRTNLKEDAWTYRGLALQRSGTGAAGVPAGQASEFWMAVRGDADSDGDGLPDVVERHLYGSNPYRRDTTGSGLNDWEKAYRYGLEPSALSTAGDGISDAEKVATGKDPTQPVSAAEASAARTSIRYAYDEDDRLVGTWFATGGGGTTTVLSPAGNPEDIRQRNADQ